MLPKASGKTLSVREAAAFLGLRLDHVYKLLKEGKLKGHRMAQVGFGRGSSVEWVIPEASVVEYRDNGARRKGG
jgi:excisionase family DNA binding protein